MQNFKHTQNKSGKAFVGFFLLLLGGLLLMRNFGFYFPRWILSWPMFLIGIGLYLGSKSNFRNPGSYILLAIGGFFLINNYITGIQDYFFPLLLIGGGLWLIMRQKKSQERSQHAWDKRVDAEPDGIDADPIPSSESFSSEDRLDSTSIFGGVKKNIVSKNFRGGEIVNIMGGAEVNLMQADIQLPATLEVTQVFGGTKIILPPHWVIHSEMAAIFGGIVDKRPQQVITGETQKSVPIKGTSIFGGITICSY